MSRVFIGIAILIASGICSALLNAAGLQLAPAFWTIGALTGMFASYLVLRD